MTNQNKAPRYQSISLTPEAARGLQRLSRQLSVIADRPVSLSETALAAADALRVIPDGELQDLLDV